MTTLHKTNISSEPTLRIAWFSAELDTVSE